MPLNSKSTKNAQTKSQQQQQRHQVKKRLPKGAQQSKKNAACQKQSCRYWLLASLFLAIAIGVTLFYDTEVNGHGVFGKSVCGTTLAKAGMLPYVENAWYTTMSASARAYKWAEVNVPPYAKPGFMLCCDIYKLARNTVRSNVARLNEYITARIPAMAQILESNLPGSTKKIEIVFKETQRLFSESIAKIVSFCNAQVFVGIFSYENMGKVYNASTDIAAEGYRLFQKKIDYYAKLK